jgi:hypothetical protein
MRAWRQRRALGHETIQSSFAAPSQQVIWVRFRIPSLHPLRKAHRQKRIKQAVQNEEAMTISRALQSIKYAWDEGYIFAALMTVTTLLGGITALLMLLLAMWAHYYLAAAVYAALLLLLLRAVWRVSSY